MARERQGTKAHDRTRMSAVQQRHHSERTPAPDFRINGILIPDQEMKISDGRLPASFGPQRIIEALKQASGKKAGAALILGIHRSTLYRMMDRYGIGK